MNLIATAINALSRAATSLVCAFLVVLLLPAAALAQAAGERPGLKEVQVESKSFVVGEPVPAWVEPVSLPESTEKYPVVTRLIDIQYLIDQTPRVYIHRAITINDSASLTKAGQLMISFVPDYHLVKLHAVRVLRGAEVLDRTASASIRFLQRERGLEQGVYSGEVTAAILVNDLRVGDTLEIAYTREGQNPVFGNKFIDGAGWDQPYPSLERRVVLTAPLDRHIEWRLIGPHKAEALTPTASVHDGMRRLLFQEKSVSDVQPEPFTPPEHNPYRWLQFSEFSGWEDVVSWADGLFQPKDDLSGELGELVGTLRAKPTDEERVAAALAFVQTQIRYFSVSLGESSHRPTAPDVVMKRRYGDCKDKSLLLITLLRALGIEGRPVLLALGYPRGLDKQLPSPQLFNHVIVQVRLNGKLYYLDPTRLGQGGPLQRMGQLHAHAQVLPIAAGSRQLVTVPEPETREPRAEVIESATLPSFAGDAELKVRRIWRGVSAENIRIIHQQVPREQIWKSYDAAMEQRYPGAKAVGQPSIEDDTDNNIVTEQASYSVPKMATERGGNWFIRYSATNLRGTLAPPQSATRSTPLLLPSFPYNAAYTFEIRLPDTVSMINDPRATSIRNKYFAYTLTSHFRGNVSKTTIELRVAADQVPVENLKKYADDLRGIENAGAGLVIIPKSAIRSASSAKKDLSVALHDRLREQVEKTTQSITSGKLGPADLANAYCLRSGAHSDLGSLEQAIADANEAIKLAPLSPEILECRGAAYLSAGELDKSIADFSKAITLGANERTLHQRGIARFYAGLLEAAAEDFAKAEGTTDTEAQVYSDLWLAWTSQRLGKALPEDIVARAQPSGSWPRPALAVFAGKLTSGELVKLIERKTSDEGRMMACEGYFYLGQYFLARGDVAKARELFKKARQTNVLIYTEYQLAAFELRKLPDAAKPGRASPASKPESKRTKPAIDGRPKKSTANEADWRAGALGK